MPNQYPDVGSRSEDEIPQSERSEMDRSNNNNNINRNGRDKPSVEDEGPACQSCRKKKAKCSRQQPCSQCLKLDIECYYDERKMKRGLRIGAVENLSQRVAILESMFLGQGVLWQHVFNDLTAIQAELSKGLGSCNDEAGNTGSSSLKECSSWVKKILSNLSNPDTCDDSLSGRPLKRRRTSLVLGETPSPQPPPLTQHGDINTGGDGMALPPDDLMDDLVELYFHNIHPWIPILHIMQFRERMAIHTERQKLTTIFHAITSLCVRFSEDPRLASAVVREKVSKRSREIVILQSMEKFSVENLQALIICAFDTIGSGRGPSAWSIVSSMTRTVEQLQLSMEDEDTSQSTEFLIKRIAFLPAAQSWIETEERRRVFWNVFLMDRFCSITTGWNFSLTSADVKRRLPCEGALWEEGKPLKTQTPYFGISDKSIPTTETLPTPRPELIDHASLGGFAYCIEASENLSQVTTFFLRHAVNVSNLHNVQLWLMRFRELDLRLIQWKLFLPEKWREACALNADGIMDPNLTLAHITHNTAVGLLHQGIAYPSPEWRTSPIRLPSDSSAETCLTAAAEVAIIAERYLTDSKSLTNPQFAFCLFISGRMLLAHTLHYSIPIPAGFDSLVTSLLEISRRWNGPYVEPGSMNAENLASKFAARLIQARDQGSHSLDITQSAYSEEQSQDKNASSALKWHHLRTSMLDPSHSQAHFDGVVQGSLISHVTPMANSQNMGGDPIFADQNASPDSISLAFPPLPSAFQPHYASTSQAAIAFPDPTHSNSLEQPSSLYGGTDEGEQPLQPDSSYPDPSNISHSRYGNRVNRLEDIHSFLEYSLLPTQRISMFSEGIRGTAGQPE